MAFFLSPFVGLLPVFLACVVPVCVFLVFLLFLFFLHFRHSFRSCSSTVRCAVRVRLTGAGVRCYT